MRRMLVAALVAFALIACAPAGASLDEVKKAEIVRLTGLLDGLVQKQQDLTLKDADQVTLEWEIEILPYFAYEGISGREVIIPARVSYYFGAYGPKDYIDGYVFHVLGLSACSDIVGYAANPFDGFPSPVTGPVWLNGRMINPRSPWYQRPDWLATYIHELAHSQGICNGPSDYVESSTQLAMLEVLAAMANHGNDAAVMPMLYEYRQILLASLQFEALRDGALEEYDAFRDGVEHYNAVEHAQRMKSRRFWAQGDPELANYRAILYRYNHVVAIKAKYALAHGSLAARVERPGNLMRAVMMVPSGEPLVFDDFRYFLDHAEERVAGLEPPYTK